MKVILDAQLGSIATKAKELKASWVILDRFLSFAFILLLLGNGPNPYKVHLNINSKKNSKNEIVWREIKRSEK